MNQYYPERSKFSDAFSDLEPLIGDLETKLKTLLMALRGMERDPHTSMEELTSHLADFVAYHVEPAFNDVQEKWTEACKLHVRERPKAA